MQRKIKNALANWKSSKHRKPLILNGARQVGKTYSVVEFGKTEFKNLVHIDFSAQQSICKLFDNDILPQTIIPQLEAILQTDINAVDTLIFFDEIQTCPRALTSLKYFYEHAPEYYVIAAGSLLGVSLGREDYSYPVGKVDSLNMYPMDFQEFLWATGNEKLVELIEEAFLLNRPLGLHEQALTLYRDYLLVGGMPEAVAVYAAGESIQNTRAIQQQIANAYIADMTKYASAIDSAKILNVWRSVPEQLAKENHKFQYGTISSSARAHQYEAPINWLNSAGIVNFCYRVSEGQKPLKAFVEHDFFKLYLLDVGLLTCLQGLDTQDIAPSSDKAARFRGGMAENYVMQQLKANGHDPYYWGTTSKSEVDFIVQFPDGSVIPIEVKSGGNVTARSLESYRKKYEPMYVIRLSTKNFGYENNVKSVPLYAAFCI